MTSVEEIIKEGTKSGDFRNVDPADRAFFCSKPRIASCPLIRRNYRPKRKCFWAGSASRCKPAAR
jgi:hypothetical protein